MFHLNTIGTGWRCESDAAETICTWSIPINCEWSNDKRYIDRFSLTIFTRAFNSNHSITPFLSTLDSPYFSFLLLFHVSLCVFYLHRWLRTFLSRDKQSPGLVLCQSAQSHPEVWFGSDHSMQIACRLRWVWWLGQWPAESCKEARPLPCL